MALPGTRADGERLYLWFGPDCEDAAAAVLSLPAIAFSGPTAFE